MIFLLRQNQPESLFANLLLPSSVRAIGASGEEAPIIVKERQMVNLFRYPGEFEPQTDVFVEWLPYGEPIKGFDALKPVTEVVQDRKSVV